MIDIQKDTAVEGEEIEVNCTAMASKPATTIRWFKGNKELKGKVHFALYWSRFCRGLIPVGVCLCGNERQMQHMPPKQK